MFNDEHFRRDRVSLQEAYFNLWRRRLSLEQSHLVVLEVGAGTAIPTIRRLGERLAAEHEATFVRINPEEAGVTAAAAAGGKHVSINAPALLALTAIGGQLAGS